MASPVINADATTASSFGINADEDDSPRLVDDLEALAIRNDADTAYRRVRALPLVTDHDIEVSRDGSDDVDRVTHWKVGSSRTIKLAEFTLTRDGDGDALALTQNFYDDSGTILTGLTMVETITRNTADDVITLADVSS